ncbi:MAG: sugar transferase [Dysgonamonadaceae bacterium]|jgi:lipopolysaccharide/colanic/teichoic acid biosynthesis glycosyltransferase|nr:sugar transferase [Dysgonamonadaceae bacterium]
MYRKIFKPLIDRSIAFISLIFLSPFLLLLTALLSIANQGKPFFFHQRPGKNGRLFTMIKFRTMNEKRDTDGDLLPDIQRLTRTGAFLRNYSLDELPNLWNVLAGEMSLVGPRPLMKEYLPLYSPEQARRHDICPGITGWAQVNGRNAISWREKFQLDVWYVDHLSLRLDLKIIGLTLGKIFRTKEVNASDEQTMEWFNGSN